MFAHVTVIRVAYGKMSDLRSMIEKEYIPTVSLRPGFVAAHLLEQVDDLDSAQLITFWDSQEALENSRRTSTLQGSDQSIAARMPGLKIERQGYIVRVSTLKTLAAVS
jgi:heme-degrading monooxygenase HmoA